MTAKRRFGDRRDGTWVRDVPGLMTIMGHLMPKRTEAEVYINEQIDCTELLKYLERKYRIDLTLAGVVSEKKKTVKNFADAFKADLVITSERQYEGDTVSEFQNCMTCDNDWIDSYRPLFWFSDEDVKAYDDAMDLIHAEIRT